MPIDAPDYTKWFQTVETIGTEPIPRESATESLLSEFVTDTITDTDYQDLLDYTVPAETTAFLDGLELFTDDVDKTHFRLEVGGVEKWTDMPIPTSLNLGLADARLAAGTQVLIQFKSTDGTEVTTWASLEGKEVT